MNSSRVKAMLAGVLFFIISSTIGLTLIRNTAAENVNSRRIPVVLLGGTLSLIGFIISAIYLFISTRLVSEYHTLLTVLGHFLVAYGGHFTGKRRSEQFGASSRNPRDAQEALLREIIACNKGTEYGVRFKLQDITSLSDFRSKHPLTDYDHYDSYIQRISTGERNVLTSREVTRMTVTSGTTGKGKWIPRILSDFIPIKATSNAFRQRSFPRLQPMQRGFQLLGTSRVDDGHGGPPRAPLTAFENNWTFSLAATESATPLDGYMIDTVHTSIYVHFLFALRERDLGWLKTTYCTFLVDAFAYFEKHWPEMIHDLANGTINEDLDLPAAVRENLTRYLSPDPVRAEEVRRECEKGQIGIIKRLWPNMVCVAAVDNIGVRTRLMETFAKGFSVFSEIYMGSEGVYGYNMDHLQTGPEEYVLAITDGVFEFIQEEIDKPNPKTVFADEVELGRCYELVITQNSGLYRYRLGDVVRITGFYNNLPKITVAYRTGMALDLFGTKVDQGTVSDAVTSALTDISDCRKLRHYCVAESILVLGLPGLPVKKCESDDIAHYVFFFEMLAIRGEEEKFPAIDLQQLAQLIDDGIHSRHGAYRKDRDANKIGRPRVYLARSGAFAKLKAFIVKNSTAHDAQFKMPKKLRTREMAEVMCASILRY